jgi:signal transduction histidine kinase
VDLGEVLRRAASALPAGGAPVSVAVEPGLPAVTGDAGRLEQVCRNLLVNARQHTPPAGRIDASLRRGPGANVTLDVKDSGAGIGADHLPHVFDRFYRADGSRSRATGGAGLGLSILRQIVLAHGGTVTVESDGLDRGSRFIVSLPAAATFEIRSAG